MFVQEYMSADPVTVREDAPLREAARLMQVNRFRHLPVLDDAQRLVGILSDRDIRETVGLGEPLRENLTAADIMSADPVTISAGAPLEEAVRLLIHHRFGALPVLEHTKLVGIITYPDALRALAHLLGLDQPADRIRLAIPEGWTDMTRALEALGGCNGSLLTALYSRAAGIENEPLLYLRVVQKKGKDIERRLREATLVVVESEEP